MQRSLQCRIGITMAPYGVDSDIIRRIDGLQGGSGLPAYSVL